mmetsp:Transcript_9746/g.23817  ORF Transcript_9746/g.23817 Transcript_9746/m.23817 type:complete len:348 (-) Transcript_9746:475-1518(-)
MARRTIRAPAAVFPVLQRMLLCRRPLLVVSLLVQMRWVSVVLLADSAAAVTTDGRHSYSLTTFDPDGKLGQVERALIASSMGTPMVGVVRGNGIVLASPQILPSPLMRDDGTSRFAVVSPQIVVGHSGIAGDGRVVAESAQRLAVEHSHTYDEPIPITLFLEELSLLFQEYTMKPGARPFGCTLLIGYLPPPRSRAVNGLAEREFDEKPRLFKMECTGSVEELDAVAIINGGRFEGSETTREALSDFADSIRDGTNSVESGEEQAVKDRASVSRIVREAIKQDGAKHKGSSRKTKVSSSHDGDIVDDTETVTRLPLRIVSASFSFQDGFEVERLVPPEEYTHRFNRT